VEESDVALPDLVVLELFGKVAESLEPAGQEDDPACLPVEAVNWMNPEMGIIVDRGPEVRILLNLQLKGGTETPASFFLDTQSGGFLHHKPSLVRAQDHSL
jgi:hypothetical protein